MIKGQWKLLLQTNRFYFKILTYFLFLLIPTFIVGFSVYFANIHLFKQQTAGKLAASLQASSKVIDVYLRTTEQTAMNFLTNETVQQHLIPSALFTDENREKIPAIVKVLSSSRSIISPYIDDLFVYADDQWVFKSDGLESFHSFFTDFSPFVGYDEAYWSRLLQTDFSFRVLKPTTVQKSYSRKIETVIPLVVSHYIRGNRVVVAATISASRLADMLARGSAVDQTAFLVTDPEGAVLVADPLLNDADISRRLAETFQNGASSYAELTLGEGQYMATLTRSEYGWSYYSVTPAAEYRKQAGGILLATTWLAFLLLVIGVIFSFIFSTKLYNPIRNLLALQHKHEQFSNEFLETAFANMLNGSSSELHESFLQEIGFGPGDYLCCCVKFEFKEAFTEEIQDTDRIVVLDKLKKVVYGILQQHVASYVVDFHNNIYACVVNLKRPEERASFDQALDEMIRIFDYDIKYCRLTIGVGRAYPEIAELVKSFGEAKIALARSESKHDVQRIDAADFPVEDRYHFSFMDEQKIVNSLRAGDYASLEKEIRALIAVNLDKGTSHPYMSLLLIELYSIAVKYATEKGVSPSGLLRESDQLALIGRSPQLLELRGHLALLLRFCKAVLEALAAPEDNRTGQLVARMIAYIDAHYSQDLYLERIAEEMSLSPKYISRLFKETTGTNLTDYISVRRIAEAKRLLAETDLKNDDIASRVGILSRATFFRLFKKYEGVTPQDYRRLLHETQADK